MDNGLENKHLVIITGAFPFLKKETFLETEILYLAEAFEKITIVPAIASGPSRLLPLNVIVDTSYASEFTKKYRKLKSIPSSLFINGLIIHKKYFLNITALRRINSFVSDALITKKWLNKFLKGNASKTIIYSYWFNGKAYGAELFAKKYDQVKTAARAHRYDLYDYWFTPAFWPFRQRAIDQLNFLYLISADGESYLKSRYKVSAAKVGVYRLGVKDNSILTSRSADGIIRIVSVSGLVAVKRIKLLAKYLVSYCAKNIEQKLEWTHLGDGPCKHEIIEYLEKNINVNLLYKFKGQQSNRQVFEFYKTNAVDVFINISESEGIPVSIMEAQSCGILVAATDVGGTSEIVNENSGVLLTRDPTYEEVEGLLNNINKYLKKFPACEIKNFWSTYYNAEENYKKFALHLSRL